MDIYLSEDDYSNEYFEHYPMSEYFLPATSPVLTRQVHEGPNPDWLWKNRNDSHYCDAIDELFFSEELFEWIEKYMTLEDYREILWIRKLLCRRTKFSEKIAKMKED